MGESEIKTEENKEISVSASGIAARKYAAELLGTFVLVFMGCGSAVFFTIFGYPYGIPPVFGLVGISLAFGLSVLVMVYAIGGISGCHINPAVTISMLVAGKINVKDAAAYIVVQCVGALFGAGAVYSIASGNSIYSLSLVGLGQNGYAEASPANFTLASCFIAEVLLTFIFLLVIHGSTSEKAPKGFAGISIGLSLVLIHIVGIPLTGTSVNPARSLGPALIVGGTALTQLWMFWLAPIIGGILAALVWQFIEK